MTKQRLIILSLLIVIALGAAGGYFVYSRPSGVATTHPERGSAVEAVYATGIVESANATGVAPSLTSRLTKLLVKEGDKVTKGTIMAHLDDREERARVNELEARAKYFASEAERNAKLFAKGTVSGSARDKSIFERDSSRNALEVARARLENLVLRAPIDGIVLRRDGEIGDLITAGKIVFTVGQLKKLRVSADVDETDILRISKDQRTVIRTDALSGQVLNGKVNKITPLGDPIARSYRVRVSLPADTPLLVGMTVEVNIVVREDKKALLIPEQALDGTIVWVVRGKRVHRQTVKTGVIGNGKVEILDGLSETDLIILKRPKRLRQGMALRNIKVD